MPSICSLIDGRYDATRKVVFGQIVVVLLAGCAEHEDINMTKSKQASPFTVVPNVC